MSYGLEEKGKEVERMRIVVGMTGASCSLYGVAVLQALTHLNVETHLVVSEKGMQVIEHECELSKEDLRGMTSFVYENGDMMSPIASGSFKTDGMVIIPCSMNTLGKIAGGITDNLITRVADVCLKERRKLILVPREMPLSTIHLENMLKINKCGGQIIPASPGFYTLPETIYDLTTIMVGRVLDSFQIDHGLGKRWGEFDRKK